MSFRVHITCQKEVRKEGMAIVSRTREKLQAAGSHSPEAPHQNKDTNSPIPKCETPASYPEKLHQQYKKYDPGYEKFEKIKELDNLLKVRKQLGPVRGPSPSVSIPSYPKKVSPSSYD